MSDEALLRYYVKEWDRYTNGATYVHRLFTYLNRHWVKREKDEGRKNVYLIYIVSPFLSLFKTMRADEGELRDLVEFGYLERSFLYPRTTETQVDKRRTQID